MNTTVQEVILSDFSHEALARVLMRRLYHIYDAGGISGRGIRSVILERAMQLIPKSAVNEDALELDSVLVEAFEREIDRQVTHEMFMGIEFISDNCFIALVIARMAEWYGQNPEKRLSSEEFVSLEEKQIFEGFARLFPVEAYVSWYRQYEEIPTMDALRREGHRRVIQRSVKELEVRNPELVA